MISNVIKLIEEEEKRIIIYHTLNYILNYLIFS